MNMTEKEMNCFLEEYIETWLYHDIEICLSNNANFACALLICCGIDFIGSLIKGRERGFSEFMSPEYFPEISCGQSKEIKNIFRNGLVHQFFPKDNSSIGGGFSELHLKVNPAGGLHLDPRQFSVDFKKAADKYKEKLQSNEKLKDNFEKRIKQISNKSCNLTKKFDNVKGEINIPIFWSSVSASQDGTIYKIPVSRKSEI